MDSTALEVILKSTRVIPKPFEVGAKRRPSSQTTVPKVISTKVRPTFSLFPPSFFQLIFPMRAKSTCINHHHHTTSSIFISSAKISQRYVLSPHPSFSLKTQKCVVAAVRCRCRCFSPVAAQCARQKVYRTTTIRILRH